MSGKMVYSVEVCDFCGNLTWVVRSGNKAHCREGCVWEEKAMPENPDEYPLDDDDDEDEDSTQCINCGYYAKAAYFTDSGPVCSKECEREYVEFLEEISDDYMD